MLTTTAHPNVAAIYSELGRLGVPMKGWWAEPDDEEFGPAYGVEVDPAALADSDEEYLTFDWTPERGWTASSGYAIDSSGAGPNSTSALDVIDPFDVTAVAKHLKAVVDGEIDEFRAVKA